MSFSSFGDVVFYAGSVYFALRPRAPGAVVALWSLVFHNLAGRRRVALSVAYLVAAPFSAVALWSPVALDAAPWLRGALGCALCAALLLGLLVDAAVLPLHPPRAPAAPAGPCTTVAHLDLPIDGADAFCNVRVFYPAKAGADGAEPGPPYFKDGGDCAAGLAHFMRLPRAVFAWIRHLPPWTVAGDRACAPLALDAALRAARAAGLLPAAGVGGGRLPVAVFSHGLAGTPDMYSSTIAELVSHGVVVFAPEHADGSAAFTRVRDGTALPYARLSPAEAKDRTLEHHRRRGQLKARALEVQACVDLAQALAEMPAGQEGGAPPASAARGAPPPPPELVLARALLGGRLARDGVVCVGHSFGGATAIAAAAKDGRVRAVAALDAWAFPLSAPLVARGVPQAPVLCLQGEGFSKWRENAVALRLLLDGAFRAQHPSEPAAALGVSGCNGVLKGGTLAPGMGALREPEPAAAAAAAAAGKGGGCMGAAGAGAAGAGEGGSGSGAPSLAAAAAATLLASSPTANSAPAAAAAPAPSPLGSMRLPPPDIGVHPGSALLGLRDVFHQSFSDFGVLAPRVMRRMGMIGVGRSAEAELRLIHEVLMHFLQHAARGGREPFDAYTAPWKEHIYPHDGKESQDTGR
jgi:hypothetical protein